MQRITNFIKYHNLVPIILGVVLLLTGGAFANEGVRNTVIGEEIVTEQGIDNSQIIEADLENFDMALQITNVTEDDEKYYIDYTYKTIAIVYNGWQEVWREKRLAVSKKNLGDRDLTSYVMEELGQVVDNELAYLKEVQEMEKEKGLQKIVASVEYTGLRGLLSDLKEKVLPEPVCEPTDEVCDGIDNDCDGLIDEDLGQNVCGVGACRATVSACLNGALIACVPGAPAEEVCGDGIDNDCDGQIDENCCQPATEVCDGVDNDCDGVTDEGNVCQPICQPTTEICDGQDNDCDGLVDEDDICQIETVPPPAEEVCDANHLNLCLTQAECETAGGFWYNEGCNIEEPSVEEPPLGEEEEEEAVCDNEHLGLCTTQELCAGASLYWYNETCDLEPETPACEPSEEVCDGLDNDCDGQIDEEVDCGTTSCDNSLNLVGECQNPCNGTEGCGVCTLSCVCAEGYSDCDGDMTNGCEILGECIPAEPPAEEPEE